MAAGHRCGSSDVAVAVVQDGSRSSGSPPSLGTSASRRCSPSSHFVSLSFLFSYFMCYFFLNQAFKAIKLPEELFFNFLVICMEVRELRVSFLLGFSFLAFEVKGACGGVLLSERWGGSLPLLTRGQLSQLPHRPWKAVIAFTGRRF